MLMLVSCVLPAIAMYEKRDVEREMSVVLFVLYKCGKSDRTTQHVYQRCPTMNTVLSMYFWAYLS